eukprot:SM000008S22318  [mRNA]  locus=s8:1031964:1033502:- [translate_table: standard]
MAAVVHGFPSTVDALQFEWAWQHPTRSLAVRGAAAALGAALLRRGARGKLALAFAMLALPKWRSMPLQVQFLSTKYAGAAGKPPPPHVAVCVAPVDDLPCYSGGGAASNVEHDDDDDGDSEEDDGHSSSADREDSVGDSGVQTQLGESLTAVGTADPLAQLLRPRVRAPRPPRAATEPEPETQGERDTMGGSAGAQTPPAQAPSGAREPLGAGVRQRRRRTQAAPLAAPGADDTLLVAARGAQTWCLPAAPVEASSQVSPLSLSFHLLQPPSAAACTWNPPPPPPLSPPPTGAAVLAGRSSAAASTSCSPPLLRCLDALRVARLRQQPASAHGRPERVDLDSPPPSPLSPCSHPIAAPMMPVSHSQTNTRRPLTPSFVSDSGVNGPEWFPLRPVQLGGLGSRAAPMLSGRAVHEALHCTPLKLAAATDWPFRAAPCQLIVLSP